MLCWDDEWLVILIFYELVYQKFYLCDDIVFNEFFVIFVEQEGICQWCEYCGLLLVDGCEEKCCEQFIVLVLVSCVCFEVFYVGLLDDVVKCVGKVVEFQCLCCEYVVLSQCEWGGELLFKVWIDVLFNNVKLFFFGFYD